MSGRGGAVHARVLRGGARSRLNPDGLLCQWAHTYDISPEDLQSIVAHVRVGLSAGDDVAGRRRRSAADRTRPAASIAPRLDRIAAGVRKATTAADAGRRSASRESSAAFDLLSLYAGGPRELERYGAGALIQTDDHTALEYSAPRGIYGRTPNEQRRDDPRARRASCPPPSARRSTRRPTRLGVARRDAAQGRGATSWRIDAFRRALALNQPEPRRAGRPVGCGGGRPEAGRGARRAEGDRRPRAGQRAGPRRAVPRARRRRRVRCRHCHGDRRRCG